MVVGSDTTLCFWWFSKGHIGFRGSCTHSYGLLHWRGKQQTQQKAGKKKHQIIPEGSPGADFQVLHHTVTEDRKSCTECASSAWEICSTYLVFLPKETCLKLKSPEILLKAGHISTLCLDNWALLPKFQTPRSKVVVYHKSHCLHKQYRRLV